MGSTYLGKVQDGLKYLINNRDVLDRYKTNLRDYDYDNDSIVKKLNGLFK